MMARPPHSPFFFFNDTATTEIYTLSLHDALPILRALAKFGGKLDPLYVTTAPASAAGELLSQPDRKSTRMNSSHGYISYAVFCLKKKKNTYTTKISEYNHTFKAYTVTSQHACLHC